jgi:ABC-type sugar transport system substrate-binding protein
MGMQAIADGEMRYTTIKSQAKMAQLVMQKVVLAVNGKPVDTKVNLVPPVVVTKDNVLTVRDAMFGGTVTNPETFKPKK